MNMNLIRCPWVGSNEQYVAYHDEQWGVPVHEDLKHFEQLILEGAQAGLSWETILKKRERYREVYGGFDPELVARFDEVKIQELLGDVGIVRNKLKVRASVKNAQVFLKIQEEWGSYDAYIWSYVEGKVIDTPRRGMEDYPATTQLSDAISKDLKKRGMSFVGSTIMYAYLQAVGIVNDHTEVCFCRKG